MPELSIRRSRCVLKRVSVRPHTHTHIQAPSHVPFFQQSHPATTTEHAARTNRIRDISAGHCWYDHLYSLSWCRHDHVLVEFKRRT